MTAASRNLFFFRRRGRGRGLQGPAENLPLQGHGPQPLDSAGGGQAGEDDPRGGGDHQGNRQQQVAAVRLGKGNRHGQNLLLESGGDLSSMIPDFPGKVHKNEGKKQVFSPNFFAETLAISLGLCYYI